MKIEAGFRRRPKVNEEIPVLNRVVLDHLSTIEGLWSKGKSTEDAYFNPGGGDSASTNLSPCLNTGITGGILYAPRYAVEIDQAMYDDSIILEFDSDKIDFYLLAYNIFPEIVKFFSPYRAAIVTDIDQELDDFEEIVQLSQNTDKSADGRDNVFRLKPVNYFDDLMCTRAFGLTADVMIGRLKESVEHVEKISDGILLIIKSEIVTGKDIIQMDQEVRCHLQLD